MEPIESCDGGAVVRALASQQCSPGSISNLGVICGLSLLVLFSALRGFPPSTPVFPSLLIKNVHLIKFDLYTTPKALNFNTYRV